MSRTRIGVLGGTFDPIHNGHLTAARSVREQLDLDGVLVAPANDPWQKKTVATPQQRLTMARLAVAGMSGIDVSDVDIVRGGQTFTIDTLADLRKLHPLTLFSFILGADAFAGLSSWLRSDELLAEVSFVIVTRPGAPAPQLSDATHDLNLLEIPSVDVSSSLCREKARREESLRGLVPDAVADYIIDEGIYREHR
jgi:nicotinate-nucleotide adenylyltransferase